jgi:hypothetical protein
MSSASLIVSDKVPLPFVLFSLSYHLKLSPFHPAVALNLLLHHLIVYFQQKAVVYDLQVPYSTFYFSTDIPIPSKEYFFTCKSSSVISSFFVSNSISL